MKDRTDRNPRNIPTRRSLLSRLKDRNDQESWRVFFDTYWRFIYGAAIKAGLAEDEAQDVVQETVLTVFKGMPEFEYDPKKGSFKGWLFRVTSSRIADQVRNRPPANRLHQRASKAPTHTSTIERVADPASLDLNAAWDEDWEKNLLEVAVERVKKKVDPRQFQIFDLSVAKGWSVPKIASTLRISSARVYLARHRVSNSIKKEVEHLKATPF